MGFYVNHNYKNYYNAAISLLYPTVLDFINPNKFSNYSENNFDIFKDYYIYNSISSDTPSNSIYSSQNNTDVISDRIITPYLPFFSSCQEIGSQITFNDLLSHKNCSLIKNEVFRIFI